MKRTSFWGVSARIKFYGRLSMHKWTQWSCSCCKNINHYSSYVFGFNLLSIVVIPAVQWLSCVWLFTTPCPATRQASLSFTISWSLLKLTSIESVMPSNHLILCCLLCSCPQSFPALGSFLRSQLFISRGQSIGASASVLPMNIHGWSPLGLAWSPCCPRDSQESSATPQFESINY